MTIKSNLVM